jgi:hypothetical protein
VLVNNAGLSGAGLFRDVEVERLEQAHRDQPAGLVLH